MARWWMVLIGLCLPWLAVQAYYALPFVKVDAGFVSRESFRKEYVAFTEDFKALDRILPQDAVIYVANSRSPSFYAPRPVIFTLQDLKERGPLYRFMVGNVAGQEQLTLSCGQTVYENSQAIVETFRAAGRAPVRDRLRVQKCTARENP